jgi:hypothetical protein
MSAIVDFLIACDLTRIVVSACQFDAFHYIKLQFIMQIKEFENEMQKLSTALSSTRTTQAPPRTNGVYLLRPINRVISLTICTYKSGVVLLDEVNLILHPLNWPRIRIRIRGKLCDCIPALHPGVGSAKLRVMPQNTPKNSPNWQKHYTKSRQ